MVGSSLSSPSSDWCSNLAQFLRMHVASSSCCLSKWCPYCKALLLSECPSIPLSSPQPPTYPWWLRRLWIHNQKRGLGETLYQAGRRVRMACLGIVLAQTRLLHHSVHAHHSRENNLTGHQWRNTLPTQSHRAKSFGS